MIAPRDRTSTADTRELPSLGYIAETVESAGHVRCGIASEGGVSMRELPEYGSQMVASPSFTGTSSSRRIPEPGLDSVSFTGAGC